MSSSFAVDVLDDVSVVLLLDEVLELWLVLDADLLLDEVVEVVIELLEAVLAVSFFEKSPDKNMVIINKIRLADVSAIEYILYFGFGDFLINCGNNNIHSDIFVVRIPFCEYISVSLGRFRCNG